MLAAAGQRALGDAGLAPERVEDAIGGVDAVEIFGHFAAEEAVGDWLRGVACHLDRAAFLVHRDQDRAGVGAVVRADGVNDAKGGMRLAADMLSL